MVDANKRIGTARAVLFLKQNGISFSAKGRELEKSTLRLASSGIELSGMANWIKRHNHP